MRAVARGRAPRGNGEGEPVPLARPREDPAREPDPLERLVREQLALLGEDPDREGLRRTPLRVAQSLRELTAGYQADIDAIINDALFTVDYDEMVCVKDITYYSLCEHHALPFFGKAHVAYVPDKRVVGLSKIPRLVEVFARRLQLQERMTRQIANILQQKLRPLGVGVVLEARHLCMEMRGAQSLLSPTVTSTMLGCFQKDARTREEFLDIIKGCRS
ncbi:MAG: GTP cyclohydrolase I FolE [Elusimicrobia bacterium]|nr:GTP cyclohydrolase I FolE [Elusimicrobiota bacterium]